MLFFCLVLLLTVINKKCECEEKHGSSALSLLAPNIHVFNYELLVEPFIPFPSFTEQENQSDLTFDASVGIHFLVTDNLAILTLDSKDPQIHRFKLIDLTLNSKHIESQFEIEAENELLHVLANFLVGHEYKIEIDYSASLNDKAVGFFYNTYFGFNQTNKGLLATVLSPKTAHTMFPCIDNPNYKATFDLTVIYPKGASIFHNTLETWTREYKCVNQSI
jgi:aminopeptidase N